MSSTVTSGVTTVSSPVVQFVGPEVQVSALDGAVGFFDVAPVVQGDTIADIGNSATGTQIATAVNALINRLERCGLIKSA